MIQHSEKEKPWKGKDYARTITWFVFHAAIILALLIAVLYWNADFDGEKVSRFLAENGEAKRLAYLAVAMLLLTASIYFYFYSEHRDFILATRNINLVFSILEITIIVVNVVGKGFSFYARPFALCALLSLLLIDRRSAIFMNSISVLIILVSDLLLSVNPVESEVLFSTLIVGYFTGLLSIYLVDGITSRIKVFVMGFALAVPITISCFCIEFTDYLADPVTYTVQGLSAGLLSVVLMMALVPFFEVAFKVLTVYRLSEITDHKARLIRALIEKAPGTFNHSLIVSTLAESCASAIGENPLLARACAYYHDVGKLKNPEFFTENQQGFNPHDELTPELSTDIIRSHAKDGYDLIRKYRLPQILADVAQQHHGTLPIRYFYMKASKFTDGELDIGNFSYQGPKPQTKMAAIIMIADGCEAKVRTLPDRSHEKVDAAVREIIEERMDFGQFDECDITMNDIDLIRKTITNSLAGVYHDRVQYPKLKIGRRKD